VQRYTLFHSPPNIFKGKFEKYRLYRYFEADNCNKGIRKPGTYMRKGVSEPLLNSKGDACPHDKDGRIGTIYNKVER